MVIEAMPEIETKEVGYSIDIPPVLPTEIDLLIRARQNITPRRRWGKGAYYDNGAYCALGSIYWAAGFKGHSVSMARETGSIAKAIEILRKAIATVGYVDMGVATYNDSHSHQQVLSVFDNAIQLGLKKAKRNRS